MLPDKKENIYPLNKENITAIINYYFDLPHGDLDWLFEQNELYINQLEWIAKTMNNMSEFYTTIAGKSLTTVNENMRVGRLAFFVPRENWGGKIVFKESLDKLRDAVLEINK